jgi:hypothetical protein
VSIGQESRATHLAVAHCEAWSSHDWDAARKGLARDVKVTSTTTMDGAPGTDLSGADAYMEGMRAFADQVVPGSLRVNAIAGDERNALLHVSVDSDGPPFGRTTVHGARLYLFDETAKIKSEHVIFYLARRGKEE